MCIPIKKKKCGQKTRIIKLSPFNNPTNIAARMTVYAVTSGISFIDEYDKSL